MNTTPFSASDHQATHDSPQVIRLLAAGDCFMRCADPAGNVFSPEVEEWFRDADIKWINLETTLGHSGCANQKAFVFQSSEDSAGYLRSLGIDLVNVANNHMNDYGAAGIESTHKALAENHIDGMGLRDRPEVVRQSAIGEICFLAYYGCENGLRPLVREQILADVAEQRKRGRRVVVNLHWGHEYVPFPSPRQQQLAREIIDAGASLIIGGHPHVMQGVENYHGGVIFYSLGNFNFFLSHPHHRKLDTTKYGIAARCAWSADGEMVCDYLPIRIGDDYRPCATTPDETRRVLAYMESISKPLQPKITWFFWLRQAAPHYFANPLPSWRKRIRQHGRGQFGRFLKWLAAPMTLVMFFSYLAGLCPGRRDYNKI